MADLQRRVAGVPLWAIAAFAVGVLVLVVLGVVASIYLGLAVVLIALVVVAAYYAWKRLPERYDDGPDKAERAELEKRREEMEEQEQETRGKGRDG